MKKYIIKSFFLAILILAFFAGSNLYALSGTTTQDKEVKTKLLNKEEKSRLIKEKIKKIIAKRKLEAIEKLKKEQRKRLVREKILRISENKRLERIELRSAAEKGVFAVNLDISNNFRYKRLQEKSLSCELSATSDIVSYFTNKKVTESYIIKQVDKSHYNKALQVINNKKIWGNPNAGYVGYIDKLPSGKDSKQYNTTGYGVLEKPIAKIYNGFRLETKIITNKDYNENYNRKEHLTEILKTINNGNMVQLWGDYCTDPLYEDTANVNNCITFNHNRKLEWYYKESGKLVKHTGLIGEHAFYLLGYKGGVENPTDIIVWDTKTGKHTYAVKEWLRKWNMMQNRSIIIYKKI